MHLDLTPKDIERFWSKVDRNGPIPEHRPELGPCWLWLGGPVKGHGLFWLNGKNEGAHRVSYFLAYGDIPDGLLVCHKCDNPRCMNPAHYFLGTHSDNRADCVAKGRHARGETSGLRLHPERIARGDRSGSRLHPERLSRGDAHYSRTRPELLARGDRHGSHLHPERVVRGERHGMARLTASEVRAIRERYRANPARGALTALGREFGVSKQLIKRIVNGELWKNI